MNQQEFLKSVGNWDNHRYFLWGALQRTKESTAPVLELGCGEGSTPFLRDYCRVHKRQLISYDSNKEWAEKYHSKWISDWGAVKWDMDYSVVLVDHSPGEHRKEALKLLTNAQIIVIHDSEPAGWTAADYRVREQFKRFKYVADYKTKGAWTSALSNIHDITNWNYDETVQHN